jgi:hypothetical protein
LHSLPEAFSRQECIFVGRSVDLDRQAEKFSLLPSSGNLGVLALELFNCGLAVTGKQVLFRFAIFELSLIRISEIAIVRVVDDLLGAFRWLISGK